MQSNLTRWSQSLPVVLAVFALMTGACTEQESAGGGSAASSTGDQTAALPADLFMDEAPDAEPTPVTAIKESAKEGDEVVMRVVVGGRAEPFVSNRAIMTVVNSDLRNQCTEPGDSCQTPWDYCCAAPADLKASMATVQFVDAEGRPLEADLSGDPRVEPLSILTVVGKVGPRPDPEALVVTASGVYVEPMAP